MSDGESKPVKGEGDGEASEHINLKVKGQVRRRALAHCAHYLGHTTLCTPACASLACTHIKLSFVSLPLSCVASCQ